MRIVLVEGFSNLMQTSMSLLGPGQSSVGTYINVSHCAATTIAMHVWAETEVIGIDRRRVTFSVKAYDERGLIGEGTHERFIIDVDKFIAKAEAK